MNYIDLFAGAGGLSEGFIRNGFLPLAHVESNQHASQTLRTRTAYHFLEKNMLKNIYSQYISGRCSINDLFSNIPSELLDSVINVEISDSTIDSIFFEIETMMYKKGVANVDVIVGGPPCQAYSLVGRARDPYKKEHDPRNYLYKQYVKFLKKFDPKLFVFENVPGILTAAKGKLFEDVKNYMNEAGYEIEAQVLDASSFGVLQQRKRVILIGWRKGLALHYPVFNIINHTYKVRDVLSDLPSLEPGQRLDVGNYITKPTNYLEKYRIRTEEDILTQHICRIHNQRDREIYKIAIELWDTEKKRLRYDELPEKLRTHKNLTSFLDRFKVVSADQAYTHTVVAHIAKDGHYYIHPDINQIRSISVREAARIQSFPDNFFFEGPRTAKFIQIGNAVPPVMAESIASGIKKMLQKLEVTV
ncbi:DNA cytosine methyltransferase [Paenibacillus melissococcoides]|uniref:Cytosine-specific methyltransferase n=1 Tax=Paenibacillus melissococcoides TaxID=2912268 RepID=A0ABM9FUX1_9BACL|nr:MULTISPECIES: DNA (cytosine-5-)-methyltransferase [Paenibacillus]MEB9892586.1 DNA (cytosine-5-)-methyltransferase [Bacillus cereus]CAH8242941.1 DNA cytosine methyltransferase [Paenibacillus melissococcoides]CAH8703438.1 DNA cytosine methyltransferase [Paenibacillus melissococcoides]CAH8706318.1 DNA cytosine methyltransferase [Paenibacillus melissococcoides]GIO80121.1 restriction endonuclease subunit M [Paenibacillus dendritiformis]